MTREELIEDLAKTFNMFMFANDGRAAPTVELIDVLLKRVTVDLGLSVVALRQVGWVDPDTHSLQELDADEEFSMSSWRPVFEIGKTAVGLPPIDLEDDEAWGV